MKYIVTAILLMIFSIESKGDTLTITQKPSDLFLQIGQAAVIRATACWVFTSNGETGYGNGTNEPINCQWYKNGVAIGDGQFINEDCYQFGVQFQYTISSVGYSDTGSYYCKVTGYYYSCNTSLCANECNQGVTSACCTKDNLCFTQISTNPIKLAICTPSIAVQPTDQNVILPAIVTFTVVANSNTSLTYQWYENVFLHTLDTLQRDATIINGATSSTYTTTLSLGDNGSIFFCKVTDTCGDAITSNSAKVHIPCADISITTEPAPVSAMVGSSAKFSIIAASDSVLTYQWYKNNSIINGAILSSYTTPVTVLSDSGTTFNCIVYNPCNAAKSASAVLTITCSAPIITTQPTTQKVELGSKATFSILATGPSLTYQWYKNNSTHPVGTSLDSFITPATTSADSGTQYYCVVTSPCSTIISSPALLIVQPPTSVLPTQFKLSFSGMSSNSSIIRYAIPVAGTVQIRIYNIRGELLKSICNSYQQPGNYEIPLGLYLSKGHYILDFKSGTLNIKKNIFNL